MNADSDGQAGCLNCGVPDAATEPVVGDMAVFVCRSKAGPTRAVFTFCSALRAIDRACCPAVVTPALAQPVPAERAVLVPSPFLVWRREAQFLGVGNDPKGRLRILLIANGEQEIVRF